jgi:hypothetical protein
MLPIEALASSRTIMERVLYVIKRSIMDTSIDAEFLTLRAKAANTAYGIAVLLAVCSAICSAKFGFFLH